MQQTNDNVKQEIENHLNKLKFARDSVSQSIKAYIINIEAYHDTFVQAEELNHVKRLISLSKDELINVNDNAEFIPYEC